MNQKNWLKGIRWVVAICFLTSISASGRGYQEVRDGAGEPDKYPLVKGDKAKNIILFIGDGMGPTHVVAARIKYKGVAGRLAMERMPVTGLLNTFNADLLVTDSSAAATAMATGYKTKNGMISVTPDGKSAQSIMEACRDAGKATGIVVNCDLTQSTPAAFAAHVSSRWDSPSVAVELVDSRINLLLGGGRSQFIPQTKPDSRRKDDLDLIGRAQKNGYTYIETLDQMNSASADHILGLFHMDALKPESGYPNIQDMTRKAIQLLGRNQQGFFLMVEASNLDSYSHRNNTDDTLREMKTLDDSVRDALEFAMSDGNTVVIVTGDHETGGMIIDGGSFEFKALDIKWASRFHTGVYTPIFAFGPGADRFTGVIDNDEFPQIMARLLGIGNFPVVIPGKE